MIISDISSYHNSKKKHLFSMSKNYKYECSPLEISKLQKEMFFYTVRTGHLEVSAWLIPKSAL